MSLRGQGPRNRRARRAGTGAVAPIKSSAVDLPGPLKFLGNPRLFMVFAALAGAAMIVGLAAGALGSGTTPTDGPMQANEAPDVPIDNTTQTPGTTTTDAQPNVQRYTEPPALSIDTSKTYTATLQTVKGPITIELYPSAAPEAVNAFVFLANEGYYNGTPFMQLARDPAGGRFYAQAGDPTRTGLGTPGFSIKKEQTDLPFARGYVGMGGSASNSNGGQFFISYGDYPALDGKYTIFGKVVSGLDILDSLTLLDLTSGRAPTTASGDVIQSVTISE
jgi:cyclophilin family peptidyl-prolyl cis-trans isomerase